MQVQAHAGLDRAGPSFGLVVGLAFLPLSLAVGPGSPTCGFSRAADAAIAMLNTIGSQGGPHCATHPPSASVAQGTS
jgi:hypothetical protein